MSSTADQIAALLASGEDIHARVTDAARASNAAYRTYRRTRRPEDRRRWDDLSEAWDQALEEQRANSRTLATLTDEIVSNLDPDDDQDQDDEYDEPPEARAGHAKRVYDALQRDHEAAPSAESLRALHRALNDWDRELYAIQAKRG
jgi:hypothetical protein